MKDIDFDELDRAVSSLMSPSSQPSQARVKPASNTPPVESLSRQSNSYQTLTASVADNTPITIPGRSPMTPPRRSGRFMDMVQTKRPMPNLQNSAERQSPTEVATVNAPILDLEKNTSDIAQSNQSVPIPESPVEKTPERPPIEIATQDDPFESPFLVDAKVDKRPLNANPSSQDESAIGTDISSNELSTNDSESVETSLSASSALDRQIADLESESTEDAQRSEPQTTVPLDHRLENAHEPSSAALVAPSSIAQQYREKPSTGDQTHTAIYDQSQYSPEPLVHPAKKRAGWLWIVWVVLLLAVGAGAAVTLYMMNLI